MQTLKELRHQLHKYPELSGNEKNTSIRVLQYVKQFDPDEIIEGIAGNGLAVVFKSKNEGPCILIRCDLDAIPVQETSDKHYSSVNPGISHTCGHDGHIVIAIGLCKELSANKIKNGSVIIVFQPSEENGIGAKAFLEDPKFKSFKPDYAFALHNMPGFPMHSIVIPKKNFSASVESLAIKLEGKECHASEPEKGINPSLAIAEITQELDLMNNLDQEKEDFNLITPVCIKMGQVAYGVSAGSAELHYTLRAWNDKTLDSIKANLLKHIEDISSKHNLSFNCECFDYFPATRTNDQARFIIAESAKAVNLEIIDKDLPFRFGEDFGWFSKKIPSCMFALGSGMDSPALHHSDYDFRDELIDTGVNIYSSIIKSILA
ncbi:MAG: amidohydrolase [Bacteroidetes bacterium]|nr:amidohydrolase [Bacteroidota bacterium]